jgi:omega-amidase
MRVAAVQFDIVWEDKNANHRIIEGMLADAALPPGSFVLLPELGDTGFSFNLKKIADDRTLPWAKALAAKLGVYLQVGFAVLGPDRRGRNCASIISPAGEILGTYQKIHPFSFGKEIDHFSGGDGLLLVQCGGANICPVICYDLRFPELFRHGTLSGAQVFTLGANWPDARQHHWRTLIVARAIENQAFVVACNRIGNDPHLSYAGGSMIVGPKGEVIAEADDRPQVLSAEIDLEALTRWRREFPALSDIRRSLLGTMAVAQSHGKKDRA